MPLMLATSQGHVQGSLTELSPRTRQHTGALPALAPFILHLTYQTAGPTCPMKKAQRGYGPCPRAHSQSVGEPGLKLTATRRVHLSSAPPFKVTLPQRPAPLGSQEWLHTALQPHGRPLHPGLPWALCTVGTLREINAEIGKQDAEPGRRAGGGCAGQAGRAGCEIPPTGPCPSGSTSLLCKQAAHCLPHRGF